MDSSTGKKKLSIVVPIHNEEENIQPLTARVFKVAEGLTGYFTEIIFVDDGSKDKSAEVIEGLIAVGKPVIMVQLSRNFGHQAALEAGIANATGDIIITMDGDQQHPPECIPQMIEAYEKGADVVQMKRVNAGEDIKGKFSLAYYGFFNWVSDYPIVANAADFRLMSKRVVDEILKIKVKGKFLRVLLPAVGFKQVYLEYVQDKRTLGEPSYTFYTLYLLAFHMLFKFTRAPIHAIMTLGILMLISGLVYFSILIARLVTGSLHAITLSLAIIPFFITLLGCLLIGIGVLAWYLYLIVEQLRQEPDYIINRIKQA